MERRKQYRGRAVAKERGEEAIDAVHFLRGSSPFDVCWSYAIKANTICVN
jgi:hypothetical protein